MIVFLYFFVTKLNIFLLLHLVVMLVTSHLSVFYSLLIRIPAFLYSSKRNQKSKLWIWSLMNVVDFFGGWSSWMFAHSITKLFEVASGSNRAWHIQRVKQDCHWFVRVRGQRWAWEVSGERWETGGWEVRGERWEERGQRWGVGGERWKVGVERWYVRGERSEVRG